MATPVLVPDLLREKEIWRLFKLPKNPENFAPIGAREIGGSIDGTSFTRFQVPIYVDEATTDKKDAEIALKSPVFDNWARRMDNDERLVVVSILIQLVLKAKDDTVRMVKLFAIVYEASVFEELLKKKQAGVTKDLDKLKTLPGIVLLHGPSTSVLVVKQPKQDDKDAQPPVPQVLLVNQPHVAVAQARLSEIPSGHFNEKGEFKGPKCLEDAGIQFKETETVDMTELVYGTGVYASCGGTDETVNLLYYRVPDDSADESDDPAQSARSAPPKPARSLSVLAAEDADKSRPPLEWVPLPLVWKSTADGRSLAALSLYARLSKAGMLAQPTL